MLLEGDCLELVKELADNSIDAIVTDPPYHLTSVVKRFGSNDAAPAQFGKDGAYARASAGFMGKAWDGGDIAFRPETWAAFARVLKPGAHLVAFGGTRGYHRMACAIEDAGFEIRDSLCWLYGTGFPKSHDVSKGIDKAAGAEREVIGQRKKLESYGPNEVYGDGPDHGGVQLITAPATPEAAQWQGWGTALKPAYENIILARKPLQFGELFDTIGSDLVRLESRLWSMLPANSAEKNFGLSQSVFAEACASAQWSVEQRNSTRDALCAQMDTSRFVLALTSSLSTVSSWKNTWAAASAPENTSITETELKTTIDLRTLRFLLLKITPDTIMQAHRNGLWSIANACNAVRVFDATVSKLRTTLELSALANVISQEADASLAVDVSPAYEPIILARKPLSEKTVAANVLRWGTGAINVDGCRVSTAEKLGRPQGTMPQPMGWGNKSAGAERFVSEGSPLGRWPANVVHDGSEEVTGCFPVTRPATSRTKRADRKFAPGTDDQRGTKDLERDEVYGDSGSAARFFYSAKASKADRAGSKHPTVKPVALMQWLCRLVTPPSGAILDPFAGSGTTGAACIAEGFDFILMEREPEYIADIKRRLAAAEPREPDLWQSLQSSHTVGAISTTLAT